MAPPALSRHGLHLFRSTAAGRPLISSPASTASTSSASSLILRSLSSSSLRYHTSASSSSSSTDPSRHHRASSRHLSSSSPPVLGESTPPRASDSTAYPSPDRWIREPPRTPRVQHEQPRVNNEPGYGLSPLPQSSSSSQKRASSPPTRSSSYSAPSRSSYPSRPFQSSPSLSSFPLPTPHNTHPNLRYKPFPPRHGSQSSIPGPDARWPSEPEFDHHRYAETDGLPAPELIYTSTHAQADRALRRLRGPVVAMDVEWNSGVLDGEVKSPTALIQISDGAVCVMVHVALMSYQPPPQLRKLLTNPRIIKTGIAFQSDVHRITQDLGVETSPMVDLHSISPKIPSPSGKLDPDGNPYPLGLSGFVKTYLNLILRKPKRITLGAWDRALSPDQIRYAANDAHATFKLFYNLRSRALRGEIPLQWTLPSSSTAAASSSPSASASTLGMGSSASEGGVVEGQEVGEKKKQEEEEGGKLEIVEEEEKKKMMKRVFDWKSLTIREV